METLEQRAERVLDSTGSIAGIKALMVAFARDVLLRAAEIANAPSKCSCGCNHRISDEIRKLAE